MHRRELYALGEPFGESATRKVGPRVIYGGGGGGSSKTVTEIPPELKPLATTYVQRATQVANTPYQAYTGQRNADLTSTQQAGIGMIQRRAANGSPVASAADKQAINTLNGGYMGYQPMGNQAAGVSNANMNAGNAYAGVQNQNQDAFNPYAGVQNQAAGVANANAGVGNAAAGLQNAYAGQNPYLQQQIDSAQQDVIRNYNLTSKPQMEAAMVNSGSFGNSGLQQMQQESQRNLMGQLGDISSGMRFQDYTTQQGLAENAINRQYQSGENQAQRLYGAGESLAQRLYGAGENQASRLYGAGQQLAGQQFQSGADVANRLYGSGQQLAGQQYQSGENAANRQFQAGQQYADAGNNAFQQERARQMQAAGLSPTLANQQYTDAAQLLSAGQLQQDQAQNNLDFNYQQFQDRQNNPYKQLTALGAPLGVNMGGTTTVSNGGK